MALRSSSMAPVDDRVVADLDAFAFATARASPTGRTLKAMITASEAAASITSDSVTAPTARRIHVDRDLVLGQLGDLVLDRLQRTRPRRP